MGRRNERGTGRIIAAGWDGADDEDVSYDVLGGTPRHGGSMQHPSAASAVSPDDEPTRPARRGLPDRVAGEDGEPPPALAGDGPSAPAPRRGRRWWLLGGLAALLVLVLVLPPVLVGQRSPETEARTFLQAIVDADTDTVREHMAAPEDGALDAALTDQVMLAAEDRVGRYTIEETVVDGDRAEITATLTLRNRTEETTLHLTRQRSGLLNRPVWELEPVVLPVTRVAVPVSASSVLINGVEVALPEEALAKQAFGLVEVRLAILPGVYQLSGPQGGEKVIPTTVRTSIPPVLGPWTGTLVELGYELTDVGREEFSRYLIDTALAECERSTEPHPESCPFSAPEEVTDQGSWKIITPPQIKVSGGSMGYYDAYGFEGVAEFTVPAEDGGTATYRAPIEESAFGLMDRDGNFQATWFGNQDVIVY